MSTRPELIRKVDAWSAADPDETTRAELQRLLWRRRTSPSSRTASQERSSSAPPGLRGVLGAGPNRMNRAVVRRATAGLARYLQRHRARRDPARRGGRHATAGG